MSLRMFVSFLIYFYIYKHYRIYVNINLFHREKSRGPSSPPSAIGATPEGFPMANLSKI